MVFAHFSHTPQIPNTFCPSVCSSLLLAHLCFWWGILHASPSLCVLYPSALTASLLTSVSPSGLLVFHSLLGTESFSPAYRHVSSSIQNKTNKQKNFPSGIAYLTIPLYRKNSGESCRTTFCKPASFSHTIH